MYRNSSGSGVVRAVPVKLHEVEVVDSSSSSW